MGFLSTNFIYPKRHKVTWKHPVGHIEKPKWSGLWKKYTKTAVDTRIYKGTNADLDHYLLITIMWGLGDDKNNFENWRSKKSIWE